MRVAVIPPVQPEPRIVIEDKHGNTLSLTPWHANDLAVLLVTKLSEAALLTTSTRRALRNRCYPVEG